MERMPPPIACGFVETRRSELMPVSVFLKQPEITKGKRFQKTEIKNPQIKIKTQALAGLNLHSKASLDMWTKM